MLSHFNELSHSSCYSDQPFSTKLQCSTMLMHHPLLQCSVILSATLLTHSSFATMLSHSSFATERDGQKVLSHFIKWLSGDRGEMQLVARSWEVARGLIVGASHAGETRGGTREALLARSVGWPIGIGDGPLMHHTRWWITLPYIYIISYFPYCVKSPFLGPSILYLTRLFLKVISLFGPSYLESFVFWVDIDCLSLLKYRWIATLFLIA
jgi:hypothetical protein